MAGGITAQHTALEGGWVADSNLQDLAIIAMQSGKADKIDGSIFNVKYYGGKADGITDDTAAVDAAAAAMLVAGRGTLYFPSGRYKVTHLPNFVPIVPTGPLTYAVCGDGAGVSVILNSGTSAADSLTVSNPGFDVNNASAGAPLWGGFTLDGTGSTGGCSGLRWGDVSYAQLHDIEVKNFITGDGLTFPNGYGWTEGVGMRGIRLANNLNQVRFDVGSGAPVGTVTTAAASGATITSLAVAGGTTMALYSGQKVVLAAAVSAPGVSVQTVTTSASVAAGATSIPITSTVLQFPLVANTSRVSKGSYGSFDYWTVNQMYMAAQPNQNGIVSEVPRGLGGNIDRLGTTWRMTGNFFKGSTNTGSLLWLKGNDNWGGSTNWDVSVEVDGTGVGHTSVRQDTTASYFGGFGKFIAYYFGVCTGASYQYGVSGQVAVNGYTDVSGSNILTMTAPVARTVKGKVKPTDTSGGLSLYPSALPATDVSYQNLTGADLFVTVTFLSNGTSGATASAGWNVDTWTGLPPGTTVAAGIPAGQTFSITYVHYHGSWAKVSYTNCTVAAVQHRFV